MYCLKLTSKARVQKSDPFCRIQALEKKNLVDKGAEPESLVELKEEMNEFKEKLEVCFSCNAICFYSLYFRIIWV